MEMMPVPPVPAAPAPAPAPTAPLDFNSKRRKVEENGESGEESELVLSREDARKLLEYLSNEQVFEILQDATVRHYDVLDEVRKYADKDPVQRKIFVRGLGWDTTTDSLKNVFSQFGELEEGAVIMDRSTGKSRGYGFITFKHLDGALISLREPSKRIDGRMTVCQLASTGPAASQPPQDLAARKIYVGNVPMDLPPDRLLNLFAQYGEIEEGPLGVDKQTGRSRGFALFIYKSPDAAKYALEEPVKVLEGHQIYCKLAAEGQKQKFGAGQGQFDGLELTLAQAGGAAPPAPNMHYGAMPQGMVTSGMSYNQGSMNSVYNPGSNPAMNPGLNSNLHSNLAALSQNLGTTNSLLNPSLNSSLTAPSLPQSVNPGVNQSHPGVSQAQTPMIYGQHAGMNSYGSQVPAYGAQPSHLAAYGGQPAAYSGAAMYGIAHGSVVPQTTTMQGAGQYSVTSYPNHQLGVASSVPRAPTAAPSPLEHPYYGA